MRARIERKNVIQKLTAVTLKSRYRVTYCHTASPGKTLKHAPTIYPLYHGHAAGAANADAHEKGGTNTWKQLAPTTAIAAVG